MPLFSLHETRETIKYLNEIISNKYLHYNTLLAALVGGFAGVIISKIPDVIKFFYDSITILVSKT